MVCILIASGFEEAEALVPADLLRRAGIETALVSRTGGPVEGSHGITVQADLALDQVNLTHVDMVVLPGGGRGVERLGQHPAVAALVQEAVDRDIWVAAICAAPTLLARWGHLKGRRAVCFPGIEDRMTGALVERDSTVVVDGRLVTGRAAGSAFDFGLKLVEVLGGADKALEVRHAVHY